MKYIYTGSDWMQIKSPDPQGELVGLSQGDIVELDFLPGGTKHVFVPHVEEAPKVEAPKVEVPKKVAAKKSKGFSKKFRDL